jgi:hypothetical protein
MNYFAKFSPCCYGTRRLPQADRMRDSNPVLETAELTCPRIPSPVTELILLGGGGVIILDVQYCIGNLQKKCLRVLTGTCVQRSVTSRGGPEPPGDGETVRAVRHQDARCQGKLHRLTPPPPPTAVCQYFHTYFHTLRSSFPHLFYTFTYFFLFVYLFPLFFYCFFILFSPCGLCRNWWGGGRGELVNYLLSLCLPCYKPNHGLYFWGFLAKSSFR